MRPSLLFGVSRDRVVDPRRNPYLEVALAAAKTAPHYRKRCREATSLEDFPLLTRADLASNPDGLLVPGVPLPFMRWATTGGSTGRPVGFWLERAMSISEWRYQIQQWKPLGFGHTSWRVVLRGRLDPRDRPISWSIARRELRLSSFHLDTAHLPKYLEAIARMRRPFLHAYPSTAIRLLQLCKTIGREEPPRFQALLLGSEQVSVAQREHLAAAYAAPAYSWYGQSEKVLLGGECSASRSYHLFPSYGVAELLDEQDRVITGPGQVGRLFATGLLNLAAPMIRYETGDLAEWSDGPCLCGFEGQRLEAVVGRTQDVVTTPTGAQVSVAALNLHSQEYDAIEQVQYEQISAVDVVCRIVPRPGWGRRSREDMETALRMRLPGMSVDVQVVTEIRAEPNGKTPIVKPSSGGGV